MKILNIGLLVLVIKAKLKPSQTLVSPPEGSISGQGDQGMEPRTFGLHFKCFNHYATLLCQHNMYTCRFKQAVHGCAS